MSQNKKFSVHTIALIGLMSAFCFISNYISIPIGDVTRIHFGNGVCALSGLLLGPLAGGFCGGIGAFLYDLTNPLYAAGAPVTFIMKFVIGLVAGLFANMGKGKKAEPVFNFIGVTLGAFAYTGLYLAKSFIKEAYLLKNPMETVMVKMATKAGASCSNAVIAIVIAMILFPVFRSAMKKAKILDK